MNSTTLRRSNITKEKVAMMQALSDYNRQQNHEVYKSHDKSRDLEMLWQSFGLKQKNEKAPQVYFITGLIFGVIITLTITTLVSLLVNLTTPSDEVVMPKKTKVETSKFSFIPADSASSKPVAVKSLNEEYTVKEGDTLESIVIRFYGSFDMSKVSAIQAANKMTNPNALSIGQKLIIPISQ